MATVLKSGEREFKEVPNKIDKFRLFSDISRIKKGVKSQNLNFDLRQLNPGEYSAPYHFHRYAEELFMIVSGAVTLRTPRGKEIVEGGDLIFFEIGESGAHQLFNHTNEPCIYLDVRTFLGFDVCEYPDSDKILIAPSFDVFKKGSIVEYFDGEHDADGNWRDDK